MKPPYTPVQTHQHLNGILALATCRGCGSKICHTGPDEHKAVQQLLQALKDTRWRTRTNHPHHPDQQVFYCARCVKHNLKAQDVVRETDIRPIPTTFSIAYDN